MVDKMQAETVTRVQVKIFGKSPPEMAGVIYYGILGGFFEKISGKIKLCLMK